MTTEQSASRYAYEIDLGVPTTATRVVELVGRDKRVLELGPATGHMSRVLVERGCEVIAIELDAEAASEAARHCARMIVGDVEDLDLAGELEGEMFDVVLAADVLEHLRDPAVTLLRLRPFLRPDGHVVVSVPNVGHGSVRLALLGGDFPYADVGLLDRTHLRFYTRGTLEEMLAECGFAIDVLHRQERDLDDSEVPFEAHELPAAVADALRDNPEARTYQFVVRARPVAAESQTEAAAQRRHEAERRAAAVDARIADRRLELERLRADVEHHEALLAAEQEALAARCSALTDALLEQLDGRGSEEPSLQTERQAAAEHQRWYAELVKRVKAKVRTAVPEHARVAVISKGDDELLDLGMREAWHFPQTETGLYAGFHPADGAEAVAQLEHVRAKGAEFLVVPATASWWLDHYGELRTFLEERCELVAADDQSCRVYRIAEPAGAQSSAASSVPLEVLQTAPQVSSWLDAALPADAPVVAVGVASAALVLPGRRVWPLPGVNEERPESLGETVSGLDAAIAAGSRFVVLVGDSNRRSEAAVRSLRLAVRERGRLLARQALAELFVVKVQHAAALDDGGYAAMKRRLREAVDRALPAGAHVLVVSRGDDDLLSLGARVARHFPQGAGGRYAGYHPADSAAAITELETMRRGGAEYLLIPGTSSWWLDFYGDFARHLDESYRRVFEGADGIAFDLRAQEALGRAAVLRRRLRRLRVPRIGSSHDDGRSHATTT